MRLLLLYLNLRLRNGKSYIPKERPALIASLNVVTITSNCSSKR